MKNLSTLFGGKKLLSVAITAALAGLSSQAMADPTYVVLGSVGVTSNMGSFNATYEPVTNLINQSGLSQNYVSRVTEFTSYVANTTHVGINDGSKSYFSAIGHPTGNIVFDLGDEYRINSHGPMEPPAEDENTSAFVTPPTPGPRPEAGGKFARFARG